jgi:hypothetical protein
MKRGGLQDIYARRDQDCAAVRELVQQAAARSSTPKRDRSPEQNEDERLFEDVVARVSRRGEKLS